MAMAGDAFPFYFTVKVNGIPADSNAFDDIEAVIGEFSKTLKDGEVQWDAESERFFFQLTQEETFTFARKKITPQIRCKFTNGIVRGFRLNTIEFKDSESKEVL